MRRSDPYIDAIESLDEKYRILRQTNPNHKYLSVVDFNTEGRIVIADGFWKTFMPENPSSRDFSSCRLEIVLNANKELSEVLNGYSLITQSSLQEDSQSLSLSS